MKEVFKIAWRNIWRNKLRSGVVITSIVLGLWAGVFVMGLSIGMNEGRVENMINTYINHGQVHQVDFRKENLYELSISDTAKVYSVLNSNEHIVAWSPRSKVDASLNKAGGVEGIQFIAIDPHKESKLTTIKESMVEGTYFTSAKKNRIVIGQKLAERLGIKLNQKVVVAFADNHGDVKQELFRVEGIYKTSSSAYDKVAVFVQFKDFQKMLGNDEKLPIHEIGYLVTDYTLASQVSDELNVKLEGEDVIAEDWGELSPELAYANESMVTMLFILVGVIVVALAFGIINTMLMAVLERQKELGVMLAIGMDKTRVFMMIVFETFLFSIIGTPIGLGIGYLFIQYFAKYGMNLSAVGDGLESVGMSSMIYPSMSPAYYLMITLIVFFSALISSLFPALKALNLKPIDAIRSV